MLVAVQRNGVSRAEIKIEFHRLRPLYSKNKGHNGQSSLSKAGDIFQFFQYSTKRPIKFDSHYVSVYIHILQNKDNSEHDDFSFSSKLGRLLNNHCSSSSWKKKCSCHPRQSINTVSLGLLLTGEKGELHKSDRDINKKALRRWLMQSYRL